MKIIDGLLDYSKPWGRPDLYLFTGNAAITHDGRLVMGRGAAKECRDRYPGIDREFAAKIQAKPEKHVLWIELDTEQILGWFKVKEHWADDASLRLIQQSVAALNALALRRDDRQFHMNYPGIGNGRIPENMVEPLLQCLPDNVLIYR